MRNRFSASEVEVYMADHLNLWRLVMVVVVLNIFKNYAWV